MFQLAVTGTSTSHLQFVLPNTTSTWIKKNVIQLSKQCNSTIQICCGSCLSVEYIFHKHPLTHTITALSVLTHCTLCERKQETDISECLMWHTFHTEDTSLLGYTTVLLGKQLSIFWRHHYPSNHQEMLTQWHGIIFQQIWIFSNAAGCCDSLKSHIPFSLLRDIRALYPACLSPCFSPSVQTALYTGRHESNGMWSSHPISPTELKRTTRHRQPATVTNCVVAYGNVSLLKSTSNNGWSTARLQQWVFNLTDGV